jgi:aminoglycoside 2''-phosphotransferase
MSADVSPEHLKARIMAAFPLADLSDAVINTDGLVNVAVMDDRNVYRFARNEAAQLDLAKEIAILKLVGKHVKMRVPSFVRVADDFVMYPSLPGEPLFRNTILKLPWYAQHRLSSQLAGFLRELHVIPYDEIIGKGIGASGGRQTQAQWLNLYEDVQRELFPLMYRSTQTWVHQHFEPLVNDEHWLDFDPVLIHDDLAQYHILYSPTLTNDLAVMSADISGVIDFGTAGLGDPARDYGILINVYGERFLQLMAQTDHMIESLIDRARFYGGVLELQWVLGGVRSKSFDWFTAHLDRARDMMPYGQKLR